MEEIKQENKQTAEEILTREDYKRIIENLLFITDKPLSIAKLSQVAQIHNIQLTKDIVNALAQEYVQTGRAIQIVELGGGFQMSTKPEYGRWVRALFNEKNSDRLSAAALETLAIIAYKQPITRAEIEAIRGVDIVAPLEKIMDRGLVRITGRKDAPGKPMVYGTTDEFLRLFGLNHISQLPELKTFENQGPKEIQSDLPFGPGLPEIKQAILPLETEEDIFTRTLPGNKTEATGQKSCGAWVDAKQDGAGQDIKPEEKSGQNAGAAENKEKIIPAQSTKPDTGLEEDMLKEGFEDLK